MNSTDIYSRRNKPYVKGMKQHIKNTVFDKPFIIDKHGSHKVQKMRDLTEDTVVIKGKPLKSFSLEERRERELALDLFGDDADLQLVDSEGSQSVSNAVFKEDATEDDAEGTIQQPDVQPSVSLIPNDPFDIYGLEVSEGRQPAWHDEDDATSLKDHDGVMARSKEQKSTRKTSDPNYEQKLRRKFVQVYGATPEWAQLKDKTQDNSDSEDELCRTTGNYLSDEVSSVYLPKTILHYERVKDINQETRAEGSFISTAEFNLHYHVALVTGHTAGSLGAATLFQVDGTDNHKIQSLKFPKFPVTCSHFLTDGRKFVIMSKSDSYFFCYDLEGGQHTRIPWRERFQNTPKKFVVSPDGKFLAFVASRGQVFLFDAASFSIVKTFQMTGLVNALAFNRDGSLLFCHGSEGEVYVWNMNTHTCYHTFKDDGCINGTTIAVSPGGRYIACGSSSGIVNVYDMTAVLTSTVPNPVKIFDRLVTEVTCLEFNSTSEVLAMASTRKENSLKLVHVPSMTLFKNFLPHSGMKCPTTLNFSPGSGYLSLGNNTGSAMLYRLQHYSSY